MYIVRVRQGDQEIRELEVEQGSNLLKVLKEQNFLIPSPCGGKGICGKCKVRIIEGDKTRKSYYPDEGSYLSMIEEKMGIRLACRVQVQEDLIIEIPEEGSNAVILTQGDTNVLLNSQLTKKYIELDKPTVADQLSDVERIENSLCMAGSIKPSLMANIPDTLRNSGFKITATLLDDEVIAIESGDTVKEKYGLAVDVGTTTIVGFLIDLSTGEQLGVYSALNPQRAHGADVITRTDYTLENSEGLKILSNLIRTELNKMIEYFTKEYSIVSDQIYHMVLVGNTIMMHIFAQIPVKNIAVSPFVPVIARRLNLEASDVGLKMCPQGRITFLPMVAGYVGSDTIGAILASGIAEKDEISLMIDIGTNGEIALGNRAGIVSCSTAAGPAFEGAHIRFGMGGVQGAINTVKIEDKVSCTTIGDKAARGICGSGIVDVTAQMLKKGILEPLGRIKNLDEMISEFPDSLANRIIEIDGKPALLLVSKEEGAVEDIYICQKDIREVQLAKAAIAAGVDILMKQMNVSFDDIAHVYLAGGFGNYINYDHAADIGLIPKELRSKIKSIGNGAGVGAKMALLSKEYIDRAEKIKKITTYIELSSRLDFQSIFVDFLSF